MLKAFRIVTVLLLVAWMIMIFGFSSQTAAESSETSGGVVRLIARYFHPGFNEFAKSHQQEILEHLQFIVRKSAHFIAYAVMGFLAFLSVVTYDKLSSFLKWIISIGICLIYSISDELHQLTVAGRSGEIRDVLIDLSGSFFAVSIMLVLCYRDMFKIQKLNMEVFRLRKRDFSKLYEDMFAKAEKYQLAYEELKEENLRISSRLEELMYENEELLKKQSGGGTPVEVLEEKMLAHVKLDEPVEYASKMIGKIVIEAARHCNYITQINTKEAKELVNLILGRTEVAKAEILDIIEKENDMEAIKKLAEKEKRETEDYFNSVRAQIESN